MIVGGSDFLRIVLRPLQNKVLQPMPLDSVCCVVMLLFIALYRSCLLCLSAQTPDAIPVSCRLGVEADICGIGRV